MKHIGKNIKRIRSEKKMTISDVANEHVSRGMISLIENGKTQASIERLQHIANQLGVDISELTEVIPLAKIRSIIKQVSDLYKQQENASLLQAIDLLKPLLMNNSKSYETAQIYELYARCLYRLYINENEQYQLMDDNNWEHYLFKAMFIYEELQMDWRAITLSGFLAKIEFFKANYIETIRIVDRGLEQLEIHNSLETKTTYIELMVIKIQALFSLGQYDECLKELDLLLSFSRETRIFIHYYGLISMKALLLYDQQKQKQAREVLTLATDFINVMQLDDLNIEHQILNIFIKEFYEKDHEQSLQLAQQLEETIIHTNNIPTSKKQDLECLINNFKARSLTSLGKYKEAIQLFQDHQLEQNEAIQMAPYDVAVRMIWQSYAAICYFKLAEHEKADALARQAVDLLHHVPHSSFYNFSRNVLTQISGDES